MRALHTFCSSIGNEGQSIRSLSKRDRPDSKFGEQAEEKVIVADQVYLYLVCIIVNIDGWFEPYNDADMILRWLIASCYYTRT
jgi:hypothetical protein